MIAQNKKNEINYNRSDVIMQYLYIFLIVSLAVSIVLFISGYYFYCKVIKRSKKSFLEDESLLKEIYENLGKEIEWLKKQSLENVQILSYDNLHLHGKYLKAKEKTNQVILLVHGYTSCSTDMAGFAHLFYEKYGFHIFMPDLRGHGKSDGNYIGFGWHERLEIIDWIQYIIKRFGKEVEIVLLGISMGGSTVLMTSGENLPNNVKLIISDCAYDSIKNILAYHTKRMYKLPTFPLLNVTDFITKLYAKYSFKNGKVYEQVKKSEVPILFIHGGNDDFVPTEMVYHLYEQANCDKSLLVVEGAGHGEAYDTNPNAYEQALESFLLKYLGSFN